MSDDMGRDEIKKVAEEMVKYVFDCVQNGNSSMAHQFVESSLLIQVEKARAEALEEAAKLVEDMLPKPFTVDAICERARCVQEIRNKLEKE